MLELGNINYKERRDALVARRELSKSKRLQSKAKRLFVNLGGFKSHFTDI
jgi:hypothetical protein